MTEFYSGAPRISSEYRDCSMPLAFDQHKGCGFQCLYCFAYMEKVGVDQGYMQGEIKRADISKWIRLMDGNVGGKDKRIFYDYFIAKRKPIQWGALGDPFCPFEHADGTGLPFMQKLADMKYPVSFSTKAEWMTLDERYMNVFRQSPESFHFKFSIITSNADKAAKIERGVPTPQQRFSAMGRLSEIGCATTLRLRPFIIGLTDVDLEQTIQNASAAGAISVSTEFFCLDTRAPFTLRQRYKQMSKVLDFDIYKFYKKHSRFNAYLRLNRTLKEPYIRKLRDLCNQYKLALHISDPDFKEWGFTGSCCGLPPRPPFDNYCHAQQTELITWMYRNSKSTITWTEYYEKFKDDFEWQTKVMIGESKNLKGENYRKRMKFVTSLDFQHNVWNDPSNANSPYMYFSGTLEPAGLDDKGDMIYRLKQ